MQRLVRCRAPSSGRRSPRREGRRAPAGPGSRRPRRTCRAGRGTRGARPTRCVPAPVQDEQPARAPVPGDSTAGRTQPLSQPGSGPAHSSQAPSRVIPIHDGSYFPGSRLAATCCADLTEMGCSSEVPPNTMPILTRDMRRTRSRTSGTDEGALDQVADGMVGGEGRVRGVGTHFGIAWSRGSSAWSTGTLRWSASKSPSSPLEDVQRRTAEGAALQRRHEGLGVEERPTPGVDDDGAGSHAAVESGDGPGGGGCPRSGAVQRDDVAALQQLVEGVVAGRVLRSVVVGQHASSRTRAAGPRRRCRCVRPRPRRR